jgi:hypothetical protein
MNKTGYRHRAAQKPHKEAGKTRHTTTHRSAAFTSSRKHERLVPRAICRYTPIPNQFETNLFNRA